MRRSLVNLAEPRQSCPRSVNRAVSLVAGWRAVARGARRVLAAAVLLAASATGQPALAYEASLHQEIMFIAARQYNQCVKGTPERMVDALQVRYAARAARAQANRNFFRRMFRWGYYEREQQKPKRTLWVVETRLHEHFNSLVKTVESNEKLSEQFSAAGRLAAYVQDVTSPAQAVPIYTARFWRFNTNDRFNHFDLRAEVVEAQLIGLCDKILGTDQTYQDILRSAANATLQAVEQPIPGMPTTWEAFWRLAKDPADFGDYGIAGNRFGARTSFRCGEERCVLLKDDPLYVEFADRQHVVAVIGTMRVLNRLQTNRMDLAAADG